MGSQSGSVEKLKATKTIDEKLDDQLKDLKGKESEKLMAQFVEHHKQMAKLDDLPMDSLSEIFEKIRLQLSTPRALASFSLKMRTLISLNTVTTIIRFVFVDQSKEHVEGRGVFQTIHNPRCTRFVGRHKVCYQIVPKPVVHETSLTKAEVITNEG